MLLAELILVPYQCSSVHAFRFRSSVLLLIQPAKVVDQHYGRGVVVAECGLVYDEQLLIH
jgi:hypothetical protein